MAGSSLPTCSALRGGPEVWVVGAWGDSITVTSAEDVMREVREFLDDGCRTITIERQGAPRSLTSVPVASGAGRGVCGCGWKSRVADDGNPEYGWSNIEADFAKHVCLLNS